MPKRRAIYSTTPPYPPASDAPPRVSEPSAVASYSVLQQRPPAGLPIRKNLQPGNGLQPTLPFEEDQTAEAKPSPGYSIMTGWVDTSRRNRTWYLLDAEGKKLGEICTKRDAQGLADLLNQLSGTSPPPGLEPGF